MFVLMADMKTQLANVAFGGSWSEEILDRDKLNDALECIAQAVEECADKDVRTPALLDALDYIKLTIGKGSGLTSSFLSALSEPDPCRRHQEAMRAERSIVRWAGSEK